MRHVDPVEATREELPRAIRHGWDIGDSALVQQRMDYWVNLAFYQGTQWVWWDRERRQLNEANRTDDRQRVRATANKIQPRINSLMGRLTTRPLGFEVRPHNPDDATLNAAAIGSHVLEARRVDDGWEELRTDALFSSLMGGTSLVVPDWDAKAKEVVLEAFNVAEFTLEPGCRRPRDARWMIVARALPAKQVQVHYGLAECPKAASAEVSSPLHRRLMATRGINAQVETCVVYTYWERPEGDAKGRVVTVVDDDIIEDNAWPYPFTELPGHCFRALQVPMTWIGDTPLNSARPMQVAYNQIHSTILENAKLAGNNRLMVPIGSGLDDYEWTDEPGEIVSWMPDGTGTRPDWLQAPNLPRDFRYSLERLEAEIDDVLYTHATSRGQAPGDRNSGLALSILAEKDDTPLGVLARDQQAGWQTVASQVLQLYAANVKDKRSARVSEVGAPPVTVQWTGKALGDQFDVRVPIDAVMPHSRAATNALLVELKQTFPEQFQNLDQSTFLRIMDLHDLDGLRQAMDDDVAMALYENTMIMQGEVMLPEPWEDHAVHIAEHNRQRNSPRYRLAPDEVREVMELHLAAHEQYVADEIASQQAINAAQPGLAAMPQMNEPVGSLVPRDHIDAGAPPLPALPAGPQPAI